MLYIYYQKKVWSGAQQHWHYLEAVKNGEYWTSSKTYGSRICISNKTSRQYLCTKKFEKHWLTP